MGRNKYAANQLPIDFTWQKRKTILRTAKLPTISTREGGKNPRVRKVKPRDIIGILRVLDDHGQLSWLTNAIIATEARIPVNTIKRTVAAMLSISIIAIDKEWSQNGLVKRRFSIVWNELALLCPSEPVGPPGIEPSAPVDTVGRPPWEKSEIPGGPHSYRVNDVNEARGDDELGNLPDFSGLDLSNPYDVGSAIEMLEGRYDEYTIALAAAIAVRLGRKPHALFATMLLKGWGKFPPSDLDHETAKRTLRTLQGFENGDDAEWQEDQQAEAVQ